MNYYLNLVPLTNRLDDLENNYRIQELSELEYLKAKSLKDITPNTVFLSCMTRHLENLNTELEKVFDECIKNDIEPMVPIDDDVEIDLFVLIRSLAKRIEDLATNCLKIARNLPPF